MEFIDNNDIENFTKDGVILCKGIFFDWVDKLRIGVDKLIANPSIRERSYVPEDGTSPFFQDLVNWNRIPEFNDLVSEGNWEEAIVRLHSTNNFPEFTGRICPAPCEAACTLSINSEPVTIEMIEKTITDTAWENGWIKPEKPKFRTNKNIAIVGSGPAGLAAAQQLNRAGHYVTVFERNEVIGGLLSIGIPEFKLEKKIVNRRIDQMKKEGIKFQVNTDVGIDIKPSDLIKKYDAICLAGGSTVPRDLDIKGREYKGIHFAMDYLSQQNSILRGDKLIDKRINAEGKNVVIIGGGDTGADCLGTSIRQNAKNIIRIPEFILIISLRHKYYKLIFLKVK